VQRRIVLGGFAAASATLALSACTTMGGGRASKGKVVVIGGGYGGATAAKYIRLFSEGAIDVTVIEPNVSFVSCPMSNLVVSGNSSMPEITRSYADLSAKHGVRMVRDMVTTIDREAKTVTLSSGSKLPYDKLIVSPGVELMFDSVEGLRAAHANGSMLQAWKAGDETIALRRQLEAMPDGGVFAIAIPLAPYRCPPGPYERASMVAAYFKRSKPRSKVLILDANQDVTSKSALFKKAWSEMYSGMIEYRPEHAAMAVDARTNTIKFEVQSDVRANVTNVLPPCGLARLQCRQVWRM
jgi:sulfide dehydrogenase [flavocytochrome c] flavoprotein chain